MVRIGVIGCGYWGPNLIRNFTQLPMTEMVAAADLDEARRAHIQGLYPTLRMHAEGHEIIAADDIEAVAIATPVRFHFALAKAALEAGKHVMVEKPFTETADQAAELMALAQDRGLVAMVGHTYLYSPAVNQVRGYIEQGLLGEILYLRSMRVNLGLFQKDINVVYDLAPHDISLLNYLLDATPTHVSAVGQAHVAEGIEDVASISLEYGPERVAYIFVSWLDPHKQRYTPIVGNDKMLVFDDIEPIEKIRIYDKGVTGPSRYDTFGDFQYAYHYGDIVIPKISGAEPLRLECQHFAECVAGGATPASSAESGLHVVQVLEAANQSLRNGGMRIAL